ncbi:MAG: hypothetical protein QXJ59_06900 [Thermofilaceae archaeon]
MAEPWLPLFDKYGRALGHVPVLEALKLAKNGILYIPYLASVGKMMMVNWYLPFYADLGLVTVEPINDCRVSTFITDHKQMPMVRYVDMNNNYWAELSSPYSTQDWLLFKIVQKAVTILAAEAVDINPGDSGIGYLQVVGSTLTAACSGRATLTATDTSLPSGRVGLLFATRHTTFYGGFSCIYGEIQPPGSSLPAPVAYFEVPVVGSGTPDDPFRPQLPEEKVIVPELNPVLYRKYKLLESKGFGKGEIEEVMRYGHEIDLIKANRMALTFSAFIPSDSQGKPVDGTAVLRVYDTSPQPHLYPFDKRIQALQSMPGVRKLSAEEARNLALKKDDRLSPFDLIQVSRPTKKQVKEYIEWRESLGVKRELLSEEVVEHYLSEDKGWG